MVTTRIVKTKIERTLQSQFGVSRRNARSGLPIETGAQRPCPLWIAHIVAFVVALSLGGCAAIEGSPEPVIKADPAISGLQTYLSPDAVAAFYAGDDSKRSGMEPREWRDAVISAHIEAADLRFRDYIRSLYSQATGFNIAKNWAVLGLTGAASVANLTAANALSAAATGLVGAGAALSKDAYYEKTVPALIAAMGANRKQVLLQIRTAQKNDERAYSLSDAMSDLSNYEAAGSIWGAIGHITTAATNNAADSDLQIKALFSVEPIPANVQTRRAAFASYVLDLSKNESNRPKLDAIADRINALAAAIGLTMRVSKNAVLREQRNEIARWITANVKTSVDMDNLSNFAAPTTGRSF